MTIKFCTLFFSLSTFASRIFSLSHVERAAIIATCPGIITLSLPITNSTSTNSFESSNLA